ncbi:coronafacic acid synthetase [Vitiosangium sp. GDMCC 1.1324]|uniref:coronafacic acid synthetase n=1 Tax=Vitiosangium sp. (strain GDMCC 1.1324) TaxID=2138576 RepID=UPI000D38C3F2|nr:coronafacic acid synthetase [Vitiosangium sp. GDMCC 1.1324]PTL80869.1 coronafacic acid synthetase [Vitiosangium sp. GDMCC 1.1324]
MNLNPDILTVGGRGQASVGELGPRLTQVRRAVRYADPSSWAMANAVAGAIAAFQRPLDFNRVALVQLGLQGPSEAMAQVASSVEEGSVSPVRFPAASPSAAIALSCIAWGIRGPTLSLLQSLSQGLPVALALARGWLSRGQVEGVLLGSYHLPPGGTPPRAACVLLTPSPEGEPANVEQLLGFFTTSLGN